MSKVRNFSISVSGEQAEQFWSFMKADYDDIGKYRDEALLCFCSEPDEDGYSIDLNLYAPPDRDRRPLTQLVVWHNGHQVLVDVVSVGIVCEFDYPDANGEHFHLDVVIATQEIASRVIKKLNSIISA